MKTWGAPAVNWDALAVSHGPRLFYWRAHRHLLRKGDSLAERYALCGDLHPGSHCLWRDRFGRRRAVRCNGRTVQPGVSWGCSRWRALLFAVCRKIAPWPFLTWKPRCGSMGSGWFCWADGAALCTPDIRLLGGAAGARGYPVPAGFFCGTAGRSSCQSWLYHDSRSFGPGLFAASPSRTGIEEAPEPKGAINP